MASSTFFDDTASTGRDDDDRTETRNGPWTARRAVTLRYTVALMLVAGAMVASYTLLMTRLSSSEDNAYIINVSGMQRMLSQRTGLMAREVSEAGTRAEAERYVLKFESALERMKTNHAELIGQVGAPFMSARVKALYDDGLAERIVEYLDRCESFVESYRGAGHDSPRTRALMLDLVATARNGFLDQLDAVVGAYEQDAAESVADFVRIQTFCLLLGLALLVIVALVIFRPMAISIDRRTRSLQVVNDELREFSYRISHDLRAPIASSRGLVAIAEDALSEGDTQEAGEVIERVGTALGKLDTLIADVIDVSRNKQLEQPVEPIDVDALLTEALDKLSNLPGFESIRVQRDVRLDSAVTTQRLYLQQILENLISNAIKYTDPDEDERRIEISASRHAGHCELTVADNGIGVPEFARDEIFGMFKRFHPRVSFGSGLGLYLVRQNAIAMGGDIVYRPLAQGSSFILRFPETS